MSIATNTIKRKYTQLLAKRQLLLRDFFQNFLCSRRHSQHSRQHPFRAALPAQPWTPHALFPPAMPLAAREPAVQCPAGEDIRFKKPFAWCFRVGDRGSVAGSPCGILKPYVLPCRGFWRKCSSHARRGVACKRPVICLLYTHDTHDRRRR